MAAADDYLYLLTSFSGEQNDDQFNVVAGAGDVNNDGFDDLLVGAPNGNYVKLYFGGSPFDTVADLKFVSYDQWDQFGASVAGDGDLNGDGFDDILIGAPGYGDFDPGRVYIHFGGADMDTTPDLILDGFGYYYKFGRSVSMAGDVNKDGYEDLVVGAPNDDYDARGRAYIYFGGENMDNTYDVYLEGESAFDAFGTSVSWVGDVNKDGYSDIIIGADQWGTSEVIGKAYLFFGGENIGFNNSVLFEGDNSKPYSYFGRVVSGLKDINGDSYDDFGIMSLLYINIYSGKTLDVLNKISVTEDWNSFQHLTDGGDLNNDGFQELLVGIENESLEYAGTAAIYMGSADFDTTASFLIDGSTPHNYFAHTLDYAGDINNDGHKDIIIGQLGSSTAPGKAFIYSYGSGSDIHNQRLPEKSSDFYLFQNYPNPFNPKTIISYQLPVITYVDLSIYNILGQKVATLVSEKQHSGKYEVYWNAIEFSSGIYFYKLQTDNLFAVNKMFLSK